MNIHDASGNLIRSLTNSSGISTFASVEITKGTGDLTVGVSTFFVDQSTGKIGIGTNSPGFTMEVLSSSNTTIRVEDVTNGVFTDLRSNSTGALLRTASNHPLVFGVNQSEKARFDTSGRLLIGATSVDSLWGIQAALHVEGTSGDTSAINISRNTADGGGAFLTLAKSRGTSDGSNTIVQSGDSVGTIAFAPADGTDKEHTCAYIQAQIDGTPGANDLPGRLKFCTTADGASSSTEHLRIDKNGKITIGGGIQDQEAASFNSGANQLLITSDGATGLTIDSTSSTSSSIHFADGSTGSESYRGIIEYNHANDYFSFGTSGSHRLKLEDGDLTLNGPEGISANLYLIADEGDDNGDGWRIGSNQDDNDLTIAHNKSGSYVDVLTFLHQVGNTTTNLFLWGQGVTNNNEAMVTVKGTTTGGTDRHSQLLVAKHSNITNLASAMRWQSDDGTTRYLYMDNSVQVRISGNYTDIGTTSGTLIGSQSSDIRLKDLVGDGSVPYGLSEINQLNPIRFKYKKTGGDPDRIQIGFSAQQVKPIIPEAVYDTGEEVEGEENILAMDYVNIIPALVNSIKELTAEVESLKTQVAELKSS